MALELIIGPAHAGKIAELYRRYLAELAAGRDAVIVVPDQSTRAATERELLQRAPGVLGADVVTFDDLFERMLLATGDARPLLRGPARQVLLRRALPEISESLTARLERLGSALVGPDEVRAAGDEQLAAAYAAWWAALDRHGVTDRGRLRIDAMRALERDVAAWPVGLRLFAQGFDDLSAAQERLVAVVGQRAGAVISLPYETGRPAFTVLAPVVERLADQAGAAGIVELPVGAFERAPDLTALERRLGEPDPDRRAAAPAGGEVIAAEAEGERGEAEIVAAEVLAALRAGTPGARIAVIAPHGASGRGRLVRQLEESGVSVHRSEPRPLVRLPFGRALLALVALSWDEAPRDADRLTWLRSPWSGAPPHLVERAERLVRRSLGTLDEGIEKGGEPLRRALAPPPGARGAGTAVMEAIAAVRGMLARAHGLDGSPVDGAARDDVAIAAGILTLLAGLEQLPTPPSREEVRAALVDHVVVVRSTHVDAVRILDPRAARTIDVDLAIVIGLEEAMYGAGAADAGDELVDAPDRGDVARHLVYAAVTRPRRRLVLVRRIADDDGGAIAPTAIWEELVAAAAIGEPTLRRRFSDTVFALEAAPTVRERARSLAYLAATDRGAALALAGGAGVTNAVRRALAAHRRDTVLTDPRVLAGIRERSIYGVTEIDRYGDCPSIWFVERRLDPKVIDQAIDNRLSVGTLAHKVLGRFYKEVPAILGVTLIGPAEMNRAVVEMQRIVDEEVARVRPVRPGDRLALDLLAWGLRRDLGRLVQRAARLAAPLVPTEFEVAFGGRGAQPGRKEGLDVGPARVSGKIDRIDADPAFTARAMVIDYKTSTISTGPKIQSEHRLQIPLYLLALREVLGREPVGGLLVSIRKGEMRGIVDADEDDVLPRGLSRDDRLDHDGFEAVLESARTEAGERIERMRAGQVLNTPRDRTMCEQFCEYAGICRVAR